MRAANRTIVRFGISGLLFLLPPLAQAHTLAPNGQVLLNRGNGFILVDSVTEVKAGDMILIKKGSANLNCSDGAAGILAAGNVYTIGGVLCGPGGTASAGSWTAVSNISTGATPGTPAAGGAGDGAGAGAGGAGGTGGAAGGAGGAVGGIAGAGGSAGLSTAGLIAGGIAVAAGVGAAVAANLSNKKPSSP